MHKSDKIFVVISRYPSEEQAKDGMMQRVLDVDSLISRYEKVIYLNLSFKKNIKLSYKTIDSSTMEVRANVIKHSYIVADLLNRSSAIYCHSIMNYIYIIIFRKYLKNLILDVHGVVPEEMAMSGQRVSSLVFSAIEKLAFRDSRYIIVVSNAMKNFYLKKHEYKDKYLLLPISIDDEKFRIEEKTDDRDANSKLKIVYVGGEQIWQNVSMMFEAARKNRKYVFEFYFPKEVAERLARSNEDLSISSIKREGLAKLYHSADLGLILREDSVVNSVAAPTKLNEYLQFNIIPILLQPRIGDFEEYGFEYINLSELCEDISVDRIKKMKNKNKLIYKNIYSIHEKSRDYVASLINNI